MKKEEIFEYVQKQYGTIPEYLWSKLPDSAVLRHKNGKWYAVIMTVEKSKLGLEGREMVDIIDVKCDPDMTNMIIQTYGFLPGYHMNKQHWITILLDGSVSEAKVLDFLDMSYDLIDGAGRKKTNEKSIVYASVHHGITVIFEQKENRGFYSSVFGCYASVFNLKNIFYRHFQVMGQPDCNLKRGITFSTFDAAYSLAAGTYGFSQICLNEIPFFTNIF